MFKRILATLLLFTLVATVAPTIDKASATGTTYIVSINSGSLNVRKKPSTSGAVVTKLSKGQQITVASQSKGWAYISAKGKKGYVNAKYIAAKSAAVKNAAVKKTTVKKAAITSDYITKTITVAKSNLGVKYKWAGNTPSGFDCSGLVTYAYGKAGVSLPRTAAQMYNIGTKVTSFQPGDLLFYATTGGSKISHVAIYIGNGQVIHSINAGVSISNISSSYWKTRYIGAKRI